MRKFDPLRIVTITFGLAMVAAWLYGYEIAALGAFLFGAAYRLLIAAVQTVLIIKGVSNDPLLQDASLNYVHDEDPNRELAHFGLVRASEAVVWPSYVVLSTLLGFVTGWLAPHMARMEPLRFVHYSAFCFPPALVSMAAHAFQAWFMVTQFSDATLGTTIFSVAVGVQIAGFIALGLHFFARRKFMKNFSATAWPPFVFVWVLSALAIAAAALSRVLAQVAFGGGAPVVDGEVLFRATRALALNEGVFDFIDVLRASEDLAAFSGEIRAALLRITWLGALDAFLSAFVVFAPIRALWSSLTFRRDDEDRRHRARYFLTAGRIERARAEAETMDNLAETASARALAALCEGDYAVFISELGMVDGSAHMAAVGRDADSLRYVHLMDAMNLAADGTVDFGNLLEQFWVERGRLAPVLFLCAPMTQSVDGKVVLKSDVATHSWAVAVQQAFDLIEETHTSGGSFVAAVARTYPNAPIALDLALSVAFMAFGMREDYLHDAEKRAAMRGQIDEVTTALAERIKAAETPDKLAFALLGRSYSAPALYQAAFHTEPAGWSAVIDALERGMVAAGLKVSAAYSGIRKAEFKY